ncbi:ATP/GTP-binding protein [Parapedobacter sp. DT-150]|uniref:ATP/GTP-binding protein n=1 Tax=Parapedobacter sp. DT-150 TaxID=3396162 RepID=UPI003F1B0812
MRIAISGTYCTGKTTTALALSIAGGIPLTHARTMRELLPVTFPGKTLRQCRFHELMVLGMKRLEERIRAEAACGGHFVSDGCSLQEWLYGSTRLLTGADPAERPGLMRLKRVLHPLEWKLFRCQIRSFEAVVKAYARTHYDRFFHLPLEFPFVADGHRPTSERFRRASEERLLQAYADTGIAATVVGGTLEERLEQLLDHLGLRPVVPVPEAAARAVRQRSARFDAVPLERNTDRMNTPDPPTPQPRGS